MTAPTITKASWVLSWSLDLIESTRTQEQLDDVRATAFEQAAVGVEPTLDFVRSVRAAILVRRAEFTALRDANLVVLLDWIDQQRARARGQGFHVLPHHEGGYQVERYGVTLGRCDSRREAYERRDALVAAEVSE